MEVTVTSLLLPAVYVYVINVPDDMKQATEQERTHNHFLTSLSVLSTIKQR